MVMRVRLLRELLLLEPPPPPEERFRLRDELELFFLPPSPLPGSFFLLDFFFLGVSPSVSAPSPALSSFSCSFFSLSSSRLLMGIFDTGMSSKSVTSVSSIEPDASGLESFSGPDVASVEFCECINEASV
uniref:(northern house mosquito) hypothetical protein n=1 Tax=Culex pipiens TaxID=7175 RepID=A0A8D8GVS7_CULPI